MIKNKDDPEPLKVYLVWVLSMLLIICIITISACKMGDNDTRIAIENFIKMGRVEK